MVPGLTRFGKISENFPTGFATPPPRKANLPPSMPSASRLPASAEIGDERLYVLENQCRSAEFHRRDMARLKPEFDKRNTKIIGLSVDPVANHAKWSNDIEETQGHKVNYPMIGDTELKVAMAYDMLPEGTGTSAEGRTAADNATVRSVFVIGPDKKIKAMLTYPMSTWRNFDEVLRLLDSCQLTAKHTVATPVNWKPGQDVIIPPAVSDDQAKAKYPNGWKTVTPYLRVIPQPK
jgi:alkyl hydroperoxide reductase subunit AhpC